MPLKQIKSKGLQPLSAKDIRIRLMDKETTIADLARLWSEETGKTVWASDISAVIARRPGNVFPEIRKLLADFLGVDMSQVGRESLRERPAEAAA